MAETGASTSKDQSFSILSQSVSETGDSSQSQKRHAVWKFFSFNAKLNKSFCKWSNPDSSDVGNNTIQTSKSSCTKGLCGSNTTNLKKHLATNHPAEHKLVEIEEEKKDKEKKEAEKRKKMTRSRGMANVNFD